MLSAPRKPINAFIVFSGKIMVFHDYYYSQTPIYFIGVVNGVNSFGSLMCILYSCVLKYRFERRENRPNGNKNVYFFFSRCILFFTDYEFLLCTYETIYKMRTHDVHKKKKNQLKQCLLLTRKSVLLQPRTNGYAGMAQQSKRFF